MHELSSPSWLLNTILYCTRIVSVFDCIYAISQNRPQNTPKKGRIQISYVHGVFTCILVQNPVYFGIKPNIFRRDTLYRRETLHILGVKPYICVKPHLEACKQAKKSLTHLISQHFYSLATFIYENDAIYDSDMHKYTPLLSFPYTVFLELHTAFADFTHTHRHGVFCNKYAYFVYTARIYVISGPDSLYLTALTPTLQRGKHFVRTAVVQQNEPYISW